MFKQQNFTSGSNSLASSLSRSGWHLALAVLLLASIVFSLIHNPLIAQAESYYVRDNFTNAAFTNNDGSVSWASNWTEEGDNNIADTGEFLITGGWLRISDTDNLTANEGIYREVDLSNAVSATLSFVYRTSNNLEATDRAVVEISTNGGGSYTNLFTTSGNITPNLARYTVDISSYRTANARIRFRISNDYDNTEYLEFDNIEVAYTVGGAHTTTSVLQTVQTYYVPVPEDQALAMLQAINAAAVSPMTVYVSISVVADETVIYYDHWEDGFDAQINNPTQATTDVWGDNNPANGMPPGYTSDVLSAGDIIILNNEVDTTGWPTNPKVIKYDGGDKLASTEAIAVTRTSWASGSGTLHGGSVEMLDTSVWGTRYDVPADATVQANDFDYANIVVMASQADTDIYRNGSYVDTLDEGQSYLFTETQIVVGNTITATKPVQANFLTGDIGSSYESSWLTLYPYDLLSNNYYAPVNSQGGVTTRVFVHNPGASSITVNWETTAGPQTALTVPAGGTRSADMPATGTGARFYTSGAVFQAISIINSGGQANDWGYTLIPANQLTQQAMVGWGVGRDPTSTVYPNENGSPVWVVAVGSGSMSICADYNGDSQGALTDNNGRRFDELITLANLQRAIIYDSDGDQTGMVIYLCNGSEAGNVNKIAVAWGQDPATASDSAPGLDVGTSVPPLPNFTAIKGAELTGDLNGDGKFDVGETFEYQIRINNTGALPIPASTITVEDIIPLYTTYIPNSTRLDGVLIPDDTSGTPFPLDDGGYTINQVLPIEGSFIISFRVQIDSSLPASTTIQNDARVSGLDLEYDPNVEIVVDPPSKIGDRLWLDIDGDGVQDAGEPGLPGVMVELSNGACTVGSTCPTLVTDANGQYTFSGLSDGTYTVIVRSSTLPAGLTQTGDPDATLDNQHTVTLGPGTTNKPYFSADFGYQGNVSIGDFVWYDADFDGQQDGGVETGLPGVTINLTWAGLDGNLATTADNIMITTTTNSSGGYNFTGLPAGTYQVDLDQSTLPADYALTTTDPITLTNVAASTAVTTADFGAAPGASISNFIWNDLDGDAVQDAGEAGIDGVTVWVDLDNDGLIDSNEPSAVTDANGFYIISGLPAGTLVVRTSGAAIIGTSPSYDLDGAGTPNVTSVTLTAGQVRTDVDFGYQFAALSISKTSSAGGTTMPGDTIQYTVTVRNNTASLQTGIAISDTLPAGTTYITQTTLVKGYSNKLVEDTFPTAGSGTTGTGWTGGWVEIGESDGFGSGDIQVTAGALRIRDNDNGGEGVYREVDLTGFTSAWLSLNYTNFGLNNANEDVFLEVSTNDGSTWTRLYTWNGIIADGSGSLLIDISNYIDSDTLIHFLGSANLGGDSGITIDNVRIFELIAEDTFPTAGNGTTGTGWVGGWVEIGESDGFGSGDIQVTAGALRIQDNDNGGEGAYREVDLTGFTSAWVSLDYTNFGLNDYDEDVTLAISTNGGSSWSTVYTWDGIIADGSGSLLANISNYIDSDTLIRFLGSAGLGGSSGITIDNVRVFGTPILVKTADNIPGGTYPDLVNGVPPGLVLAADVFALNPGQSMTVSYTVTVNDLVALNSIYNRASVVSTQQPTPQYAATNDTLPLAAIGNSVWLDENGDGYRDAGEAGIPNLSVQLWNADHTILIATTTTDSNGNYIFKDVTPATYQVDVLDSSLPTGLVQTTVIGGLADNANKADPYTLSVTSGSQALQADFGFNWASSSDTDGNTGAGAIGDRLWIDADGDGNQDPGEAGLSGISVALLTPGADGVFGTSDDITAATTTTDAAGSYIFDGLAAGAYAVVVNNGSAPTGYAQTGDPDQSGALCTTCDHRTTTPILLAPGDVFVNADFGYRLSSGANTIGNQIFIDSNGDGNLDSGESGIPGVTVALLDASGKVIASAITDASGQYSFPGLPDGSYTVWVNDTANVLGGLNQNSTPNNAGDGGQPCGSCNGRNTVTVSGGSGSSFQDFGYAPAGHGSGDGLIGDTIFYDRDADGAYDIGEGLEDVRVDLYQDTNGDGNYDSGEPLYASTVTDENGNYFFGNLPAGNYVVKVATGTLPGGVTNTVDQGDATLNEAGVSLAAGGTNLGQDFGYRDTDSPNSISGTIWNDTNADGALSGEGTYFQGITVVLKDSNGKIVATTSTDASGNYSFNNLPDGTYNVDVTDDNNVLDGYWHSQGTAGSDHNSQSDPYTVTVTGGQNNTTADFGYYCQPAALGNFVWLDLDPDGSGPLTPNGVQDANEPGVKGIEVVLTITYPNATVVTLKTKTGDNGAYSFGNLLLDEDFDGAGSGEPTYSIGVSTPPSMNASAQNQTTEDLDSDNPAGEAATVTQGSASTIYDFGFSGSVDLGDLPESIGGTPYFKTFYSPGPSNVVFPDGSDDGVDPDTTNGVKAVWLGLTIDTELDGQPSLNADGDGTDEDGLFYDPSTWQADSVEDVTVRVNSSEPTTVYFGLWIDWDYNGAFDAFYNGSKATSSPAELTVPITVPVGFTQSSTVFFRLRASAAPLDSGDYLGTLVNGEVEDYRWPNSPTAVTLTGFQALSTFGRVVLTWETAFEFNTLGYNIYRSTSLDGPREKVNLLIIPCMLLDGKSPPFNYEFVDANIQPGVTYYYWLEEVAINASTEYGPVQVTAPSYGIFLPILQR